MKRDLIRSSAFIRAAKKFVNWKLLELTKKFIELRQQLKIENMILFHDEQAMSYMRGNYYLWSDGDNMHLWVADGYDGWDESGWNTGEKDQPRDFGLGAESKPSGVKIPEKVLDEFVMMRLAPMIHEGVVEETIDRAIKHGNFGGMMLKKNAQKLKTVLTQIKLDEPGSKDV